MVTHCAEILGVLAATPNENKISHGSGERVAAPGSTLVTLDIQENDAV